MDDCADLVLHGRKTVVVPLMICDFVVIKEAIANLPGILASFNVSRFAKYLGVHCGPEAHVHQWIKPLKGFREASEYVRALNLGLAASIPLYNSLAHSKLAWLASHVNPSAEALKEEQYQIQKLTVGPWLAFPPALMFGLKAVGLPCSCRSLAIASRAGQYRNASVTSQVLDRHRADLRGIWSHDERVLRPECLSWIDNTVLFCLIRPAEKVDAIGFTFSQNSGAGRSTQAAVYKHLHTTDYPSFLRALLLRRWARWFPERAARRKAVFNAMDAWNQMKGNVKPCVLAVVLKAWLNSWVTHRRFNNRGIACFFCGMAEDSIEHMSRCDVVSNVGLTYFQQRIWQADIHFLLMSSSRAELPIGRAIMYSLHWYAIFKCHAQIRHSRVCFSSSVYSAVLKSLAQSCPKSRQQILDIKFGGLADWP